jgi:acetyl esterase/lipase
LIAATGLIAVNYSNREPVGDLGKLLRHLAANSEALGLDSSRMGLIASSGHGPLALSALMDASLPSPPRAALLICPFALDLDGHTAVADAAKTFRFANPAAGRSVDELPRTTPLFIARAGQDQMPGLNETLDRFTLRALAGNLPLTLVNHEDAPHAFDLMHDSETSREIIRNALAFLRLHLTA